MRNPISRFSYAKSDIDIKRSTFDRSTDHKTTMSAGLLYPLLVDEVLPGDTYTIDIASLVRMSTPIHPVLDNAFLDIYFFFCPNRLTWEHWREFMGESPSDPYVNPIEYSIPMLTMGASSDPSLNRPVPAKSLLDYMGVPAGTVPKEVSALPFRAFCKIWNEWFRDQNLQNAIDVPLDDNNRQYATTFVDFDNNNKTDSDAYVKNAAIGGDLPPVNKYHDYFTSALIAPQKGDPVPIPINGWAPVYPTGFIDVQDYPNGVMVNGDLRTHDEAPGDGTNVIMMSSMYKNFGTSVNDISNGSPNFAAGNLEVLESPDYTPLSGTNTYPSNLAADLSFNAALGAYATINDLRSAFQLQKYLEADSRGGTRYREILKSHFGVTSPDASLQVPEFLGGKRIPINISQVLQTSSTDSVSPQGNTAAYSLTTDSFSAFTKSFTEHGYLFCVGCIRTEHTYAQGIEKMFFRKNKFDFYFPEFANISEQPIYNKEIFNGAYGTVDFDLPDQVFGFQEAWAEYRYKPSRVSAEFSPTYPQSLDVWHYSDYYTEQPILSSEWIRETRANIDRTLAVNDPDIDQFICDFYFKMRTTRIMPVTSIPGLADHH